MMDGAGNVQGDDVLSLQDADDEMGDGAGNVQGGIKKNAAGEHQ